MNILDGHIVKQVWNRNMHGLSEEGQVAPSGRHSRLYLGAVGDSMKHQLGVRL